MVDSMGEAANDNSVAAGAVRHIYVHIPILRTHLSLLRLLQGAGRPGAGEAFLRGDSDGVGRDLARCRVRQFVRGRRFALQSAGIVRSSGGIHPRASQREATRGMLRPETIFFGGGTPTALHDRTARISCSAASPRQLDLSELQEWTLEANPGSVSERKARLLREHGVNRISLGVQSFDDGLLRCSVGSIPPRKRRFPLPCCDEAGSRI